MNSLLGQRYEVRREIGSGGYGRVCRGYDHKREKDVAIKLEEVDELEGKVSSLKKEQEVYSHLKGEVSIGIADIHLFGADLMDDYGYVLHYMVMDLLGPDLEQLFTDCSEKFSLKTVLLLADQMIRIIQYVHSKDYIHGDIKPGNFVIGRGKMHNMIYMVDFGLAHRYRDSQTKEHIPYSDTASYGGTTRFTSLNCHQRIQQSRRDDLESFGYVLLYLLRGSLPWQGIKHWWTDKSEKRRLVYEKKSSIPIKELCTGLPSEFVSYMEYCRSLQFDEEPDYDYLRKLFQDLYDISEFTDVLEYDWTGKNGKFHTNKEITASSVKPWEMKHHLQVSYSTLPALSKTAGASIEQHVEESFCFMFPKGVPKYFTEYYTTEATWKSVVPQLCSDFFAANGNWLKEHFKIDYSDATLKDIEMQEKVIQKSALSKNDRNSDVSVNLALCIHRLMRNILNPDEYQEKRNDQQKVADPQKHDRIKSTIYRMLDYAGVTFLSNGDCQYEWKLQYVHERDRHEGPVTLKSRPDATLCIERCPYAVSDYPYCALEVYGPYSDKFMKRLEETSPLSSSPTDLLEKLSLDHGDNESNHHKLNKEIRRKVPFSLWPEKAFSKITGQLVMEMYGVLVEAERLVGTKDDICECMGMFAINEHLYLAKSQIPRSKIQLILVSEAFAGSKGPDVCYSNWYFDFKKPNARLGFLIFLFHYKFIALRRGSITQIFS